MRLHYPGMPTIKGRWKSQGHQRDQEEENHEPVPLLVKGNRESQGQSPRSSVAVILRQLLGSKLGHCVSVDLN